MTDLCWSQNGIGFSALGDLLGSQLGFYRLDTRMSIFDVLKLLATVGRKLRLVCVQAPEEATLSGRDAVAKSLHVAYAWMHGGWRRQLQVSQCRSARQQNQGANHRNLFHGIPLVFDTNAY